MRPDAEQGGERRYRGEREARLLGRGQEVGAERHHAGHHERPEGGEAVAGGGLRGLALPRHRSPVSAAVAAYARPLFFRDVDAPLALPGCPDRPGRAGNQARPGLACGDGALDPA